MSTRLKRRSFWRHLAITFGLVAFQGYLGYSVLTGQFGIESQDVLNGQIDELKAQSGALQAEIDSYRHRVDLFNASSMDPDILSERGRALLSMAQADDIVVMVDPANGQPVSGSTTPLPESQLNPIIETGID